MDALELLDPDAITLPYSGIRLNTLEDFEMDFGQVWISFSTVKALSNLEKNNNISLSI